MSFTTRNGKLERTMSTEQAQTSELKFHVVTSVTVRTDKDGKVVDVELRNTRVSTKPEDKMTKQQLQRIMENSDNLIEMTGVCMVEQVNRKRNPVITVPSTTKAGDGEVSR